MDHRRRADGRVRSALVASLALHAAIIGFAVVAEGSPPKPPKTKVYAVDIVSPPPNVAGEMPAEPPATQEPGPAAASEPAPAEAAPEPTPPAPQPDPEPAPPRTEAPKEPAKAPEPRRTPEQPKQRPAPEQPKQRPSTTPNRPSTTTTPSTSRPSTPATNRPATSRPASGTSGTSGQSGTGSGPNRTQGTGTRTGPATGSNPDANSPGGEGLNIHVEGEPCPVAGYCENVTRQVNRFFRPPPESTGGRGEVCFRIQRDGSVTEITPQRVRGSASFRIAMMEAAEAAGSRRAFGTLPGAFDPARWRWCVELSPR